MRRFLSALFGKKTPHPTSQWIERAEHSHDVDLDEGTFGGVALGAPIEALSWLGPADARPKQFEEDYSGNRHYSYPSKGLTISDRDGQFTTLQVSFIEPDASFTHKIFVREQQLQIGEESMTSIVDRFGPPSFSGPVETNFNDFRDYCVEFQLGAVRVRFWSPLSDVQDSLKPDQPVAYITMERSDQS